MTFSRREFIQAGLAVGVGAAVGSAQTRPLLKTRRLRKAYPAAWRWRSRSWCRRPALPARRRRPRKTLQRPWQVAVAEDLERLPWRWQPHQRALRRGRPRRDST